MISERLNELKMKEKGENIYCSIFIYFFKYLFLLCSILSISPTCSLKFLGLYFTTQYSFLINFIEENIRLSKLTQNVKTN